MPTFEIPDGPTSVELKRSGNAQNPGPATGSVAFSVTNTSGDGCAGRLSVVPSGGSKLEWFAIDGDRERTFASGETQTATINVSAPAATAAGDYPFRLRAVAVNDPDNDHVEGPVATAKVPAIMATDGGGGMPWWVWLIIGLVVLAAISIGLFLIFHNSAPEGPVKGADVATSSPPATPVPTQPAARMHLEPGYDRPGLDIQAGQTVPDARACAKLCQDTDKCVAMTYVFPGPGQSQNGACWIKYGIPGQVPNPYMISGVKVPS